MSRETGPAVKHHDADAALQSTYRDLGAGDLDRAEGGFRHVLEYTGERAKALNGLGFFAGWQRAVRSGRIDGFWLTYEELMQDKVGKIDEILQFHRIDRPRTEIADAIDRASANKTATHFNMGVVGRGRAHFTDRQIEQIARIASHHPDIDFSRIGL